MIDRQKTVYSLLAFLLLSLTACGGGNNNVDGKDSPLATGKINSEINGRLFMGNDLYGPWLMDFSTGRYTPVPGMQWEDNPNYRGNADFSAYPAVYDGGIEFIETIEKCRDKPRFGDFIDCIIIRDSQGEIISQIDVPYETQGPAKLSRDRQYFAVPIESPFADPDPKQLTLFTRDGALIDASDEDVRSFDWLPDNRLIYATGQSIYITPLGSVTAKGSKILTFPDNAGKLDQFAISPNGSQLAFTLVTRIDSVSSRRTTWVMDFDNDNLRQLTNTPDDDPKIIHPTWSPDGRWIAVVEGTRVPCNPGDIDVGGLPPSCIQTQTNLYIVPSDGENVMLTEKEDITTSAVLIYSYFDDVHDYIDNPELDSRFNMGLGGSLAWLP